MGAYLCYLADHPAVPARDSSAPLQPISGGRRGMLVRDGMNPIVFTVGPEHTLREAARRMTARPVGAAVVMATSCLACASSPSATSSSPTGSAKASTASRSAATLRGIWSMRTPTGRWNRRPQRWCAADLATSLCLTAPTPSGSFRCATSSAAGRRTGRAARFLGRPTVSGRRRPGRLRE